MIGWCYLLQPRSPLFQVEVRTIPTSGNKYGVSRWLLCMTGTGVFRQLGIDDARACIVFIMAVMKMILVGV